MHIRFSYGARLVLFCGLCVSAAGCQTTGPGAGQTAAKEPLLNRLFAHKSDKGAVASTKQPAPKQDPAAKQASVVLATGMEVSWTLKNPVEAAGQVQGGKSVIGPDGAMVVGPYGACKVAGLTMQQAAQAVEKHLAPFVKSPAVRLTTAAPAVEPAQDVAWRPSQFKGNDPRDTNTALVAAKEPQPQIKQVNLQTTAPRAPATQQPANAGAAYFIMVGDKVLRMPSTGQDTVLDALSRVKGMPPVTAKNQVWVARPDPAHPKQDQILPVDWQAITQGTSAVTNYELQPGDRIHVRLAAAPPPAPAFGSRVTAAFHKIFAK